MNLKTFIKVCLALSAIFLPFWVTCIIFIFSVLNFENFYFAFFVMFFFDLLYGFETIFLWNIPGVVFFGSAIFFSLTFVIKKFVNINR